MSITFFWYISLPSLRDYVKIIPYFLVHGGHKQAITKDTQNKTALIYVTCCKFVEQTTAPAELKDSSKLTTKAN